MNRYDMPGAMSGRYDIDEVDPDLGGDLIGAFGDNYDGDDELYIPGALDEETIARLDEVFRLASERQAHPKKGVAKAARPGHRMNVGSIKAIEFAPNEAWLIEDIDTHEEHRMAKSIIPKRLWEGLDVGDLIDFTLGDGALAPRARRHDTEA